MSILLDERNRIFCGELISCSCATLLIYDFCITIDQAAVIVLTKKWTGVTWIYVLNQFAVLLPLALACIYYIPTSTSSCRLWVFTYIGFILLQDLMLAVLCSMRVYALSGRMAWLAILVLLLGCAPVAADLFVVTTTFVEVSPECGECGMGFYTTRWVYLWVTLVMRVTAVICDIIVLAVTLCVTWSTYMHARKAQINVPLTSLLIRDGILYFMFIMGLQVAFLVDMFKFVPLPEVDLIWFDIMPFCLFQSGVPILISRFILNLRQVAHADVNSIVTDEPVASVSSLRVRVANSVVDNMGESLDHAFD